jgi:hypothetical protein
VPDGLPRVFVNCPYDAAYEPRRDAIILACVGCGFYPTSAVAGGSGGRLRIQRILDELETSRLSVHDLSRARGEGTENLARFNMPLELGMAMYLAHREPQRHDWLALVPEEGDRQRFISDLNGFDPVVYNGSVEQLVQRVVGFLTAQSEAMAGVDPRFVLDARQLFAQELDRLRRAWLDAPPWARVVEAAERAFQARVGDPASPPPALG